jgi:hypothetical protein
MSVSKIRVTSSSFIDRIAYDSKARVLSVMFTNGNITQYLRVGSVIYNQFVNAESKGKFWNERIKSNYESQISAAS